MSSIWCPQHHTREPFTPPVSQPLDTYRVRYPCGDIYDERGNTTPNEQPFLQAMTKLTESLERLDTDPRPMMTSSPPRPKRPDPIQRPPSFYKEKGHDVEHFA